MQIMEQIRNLPRPIGRTPWREHMMRQIPLTSASTLCMLLGILGVLSHSQEQFRIIPEYPSPIAFKAVDYRTEPVELLRSTNTIDPVTLSTEYIAMDALSQSAPGLVGTTPHDLHSAQTAEGFRQQETSISGKVTSKADGKPMVGVKAWLGRIGRDTAVNTDGDGNYIIVVKRLGRIGFGLRRMVLPPASH